MDGSIHHYRSLIESALAYSGGTHTFEDVVEAVVAEDAQFWPAPTSCVVTQVEVHPSRTVLHFFIAAGNSVELKAMEPGILEWGKEQGCTVAKLVGRKGWERSFLADTGWHNSGLIIMEKEL